MELTEAERLLRAVAGVDAAGLSYAEVALAVAELGRLRAYLDSCAVVLARRMAEVSPAPELALAEASRCSPREADRVLERASVAESVAVFGEALAAGALTAAHVDAVGQGLRALEPSLRPGLVAAADRLVEVARRSSPGELERAVKAEVRRLQEDGGMSRFERQRRSIRLRTWTDRDGMYCVTGRFDPVTGVKLDAALRAVLARQFAAQAPADAPSDAAERQDYLRGLALAAIVEGDGCGAARPEFVVVVDTSAPGPGGGPELDWGLPVEVPSAVLRDLFHRADAWPVVVRNGAVLHAPGRLDLGRSTRLANRAQRRALRALYRTCAVPGCDARFDVCDMHHVVWWEAPHNGTTDLHNLLPLCDRHHHCVHDRGWQLRLAPDRTLTIRYPDGTTAVARPNRRERGSVRPPVPPQRR